MTHALKPLPPALPLTAEELVARMDNPLPVLNDEVRRLHLHLWRDEAYRKLHWAVYDEQAVEGSLACDNTLAATAIRDLARENGDDFVGKEKLATIVKALNRVLRRMHMSRKERRNLVDGEMVPDSDNGDN